MSRLRDEVPSAGQQDTSLPAAVARPGPWTVRPAREDDVDGLRGLHERVFGRPISREHWMWKLGGRRGPVPNVWVAEYNGRIIFQYAGIPTRVRHFGVECWAMVSVDTMTDPHHRRRGLLTEVGSATYARWREGGIPFVVGLPNERWGSRTEALGWAPVTELRRWVRWLGPGGAWAKWARLAWPRSARVQAEGSPGALEISSLVDPSPFDGLWLRSVTEGVVRDSGWFRWRYLDAVPKWSVLGAWQGGRLVGGAAFRFDEDREPPSGIIGEVLAQRFSVARLLLARCNELLRAMGAGRSTLLIQSGSVLEEAALAAGFLPRPSAFAVKAVDLGGGLPLSALFHGGDFDVA